MRKRRLRSCERALRRHLTFEDARDRDCTRQLAMWRLLFTVAIANLAYLSIALSKSRHNDAKKGGLLSGAHSFRVHSRRSVEYTIVVSVGTPPQRFEGMLIMCSSDNRS